MAKTMAQIIDERIEALEIQKRSADLMLIELRQIKAQSAASHQPKAQKPKAQAPKTTQVPKTATSTVVSLKGKTLLQSAESVLRRFPGKKMKLSEIAKEIFRGGYTGRGRATPKSIATGLSKTLSEGVDDGRIKSVKRIKRGEYVSL